MMTSRTTFAAFAIATALTVVGGRPALAATAGEPRSTTPAATITPRTAPTTATGRLLAQITAVRAAVASNAQHLLAARTDQARQDRHFQQLKATLRAAEIQNARLLAELNQGVAKLYMLRGSSEGPQSLLEEFRKVKVQIEAGRVDLAKTVVRARAAKAAVALNQRKVAVATARLAQLEASARKLGVRAEPRVAPRAGRSARRSYICPVVGPVNPLNDFGERRGTGRHTGVDMLADTGQPAVAVFAGTIMAIPQGFGSDSGYGLMEILRDGAGNVWWYAHLSQKIASPGEKVDAGQIIGRVGCTGRCSGSHLHFELHPHGQDAAVDPYPFLMEAC